MIAISPLRPLAGRVASAVLLGTNLLLAMTLAAGCGNDKPAGPAMPDKALAKAEKPAVKTVKKPQPKKLGPAPRDLPLKPWKGDDDEVELFSAAITAVPCARKAAKAGAMSGLSQCSPRLAATRGLALVDPQEKGIYLVEAKGVHAYEMEQGFKGAMDISGTIIGQRGGIPVIKPEEYTIRPKPKAGAFKGCL